ncbi:hypothetical protein JCM10213v2_005862 [Rhodosporidiobolus nylandii]
MSGFFPAPLKLQDYERAASASPGSSTAPPQPSSTRDLPSPNKKRRVDSAPPASRASAQKPSSSSGTPTLSRAQRIAEEQALLQSRLHSTLRLRDTWDEILRRHSTPSPSSPAAGPSSFASAKKSVRHRPVGFTRALPVEEDDIIDLRTLEIVEDRGVLRNSRAGGFAIGGPGGMLDDVVVGQDSGAQLAGSSGDEEGESDEEEEEVDWEEPDEDGYFDSDDELAEMDDLPSLPSLLFREERKKEAERTRELEEFRAQEARARGEALVAHDALDGIRRRGSEQLPEPIPVDDEDEEDELGFFAQPAPASASPAPRLERATPARPSLSANVVAPPSTTSALRQAVQAVHLASSPVPSSSARPSSSPTKPPSKRASKRAASADLPTGLATPPTSSASTTAKAKTATSSRAQSKPRSSSSPLKNVIVIPSRSPSPELGLPPPARAISPELGVWPPAQAASTPSAPFTYQRPTPTPTPPPSSRITTSARTKRQHSFDLIIDIPAPRSLASAHPRPSSTATPVKPKGRKAPIEPPKGSRQNPPTVKKQDGLPTSRSMPALSFTSDTPAVEKEKRAVSGKAKPKQVAPEVDPEDDVFDTGLATPPLSKRSAPAFSPPPHSSSSSTGASRSSALPLASAARRPPPRHAGEEDNDDDPLLLCSSPAPSSLPAKPARAARPSASRSGGPSSRLRRTMSMPLLGEDSESDDELMLV